MRERWLAFKTRHGRWWAVVLVMLAISFAFERWQDIDFAVNHRSELVNFLAKSGNFVFSDWFLIPAFLAVTLIILWVLSRPVPDVTKPFDQVVQSVLDSAAQYTERPTGVEIKYPSGRQDAIAMPETVAIGSQVPRPSSDAEIVTHRNILDITPEYLTKFYKDHTTYQAEQLIKPFLHQWMRVSGTFNDLTQEGYRDDPPITLSVAFEQEPGQVQLFLRFSDEWRDRLLVVKRGDHITAVGKIFRTWPTAVQLVHCELFP